MFGTRTTLLHTALTWEYNPQATTLPFSPFWDFQDLIKAYTACVKYFTTPPQTCLVPVSHHQMNYLLRLWFSTKHIFIPDYHVSAVQTDGSQKTTFLEAHFSICWDKEGMMIHACMQGSCVSVFLKDEWHNSISYLSRTRNFTGTAAVQHPFHLE